MITFEQIKERKLGRWGLTYLAGAWLVLQLVSVLGGLYHWPTQFMRAVPVVLVVGFFAALVVAWYHGERGAQRVSGAELALLIVLFVIAGAAVALVGAGEPTSQPEELEGAAPLTTVEVPAEQASIAVLPFENMSSDPEQAYFSDGLTEELLNALAQIPGLRVSARTSAFAFKDMEVTADSIGRVLHVAHLVEGSVRKSGGRVRITTQLIDARSGFQQWGQTYDRELADVFAVQDEISRAIADELRVRVGNAPLVGKKTADPEAYSLFLQALQVQRKIGATREFLNKAERLFQAALARDSSYAEALAGLAEVHTAQAYNGLAPKAAKYAQARDEAERAVALNPNEAGGHFVLGRIADFYDRDYMAAADHYRRALELNPSDVRANNLYGWLLMRLGRPEDGLREGRRAVELDPLSIAALNNLGELYRFVKDYEHAIEQYKAALALNPDAAIIVGNLTLAYTLMGRTAEAIATGERALSLDSEDAFNQATMAYVYARAGRRSEAEYFLSELPADAYFLRAMVQVGLGDNDAALELLERALEDKDDYVGDVGMDPVFEPLYDDPRFARLLERLGVVVVNRTASR